MRKLRRGLAAVLTGALVVTSGLAVSLGVAQVASATAPAVANGGNVTLNLFQWNWNSVAAECTNQIGPAGYAYVQVSPPQEHIQGSQWWTSYQPVSYKIESKLGTRAEFKNMVDTCRTAGVGIIADSVINHMAGVAGGTGVAGTNFSVENYPGPQGGYGPQDFNSCKADISNYSDRWNVQNCRLSGLQDLATGNEYVRSEIAAYLDDLADLGVAGYRIDAAKHIPATDLQAIKNKTTKAKNLYWVQEVIGSPGEPIQPSEYTGIGDVHEFNYARGLKSKFDGNIADLQNLNSGWGLLNSSNAGVFVDNHDTERNGETMNYKWEAKYLLGNIFMLSYPYGSPAVYSGYKFTNNDAGAPQGSNGKINNVDCSNGLWTCEHRKPEIKNMVKFNNVVAGTTLNNWQSPSYNVIGYGRGDKGFVVLNNTGNQITQDFATPLAPGTYCDVVAGDSCTKTWTVGANGHVTVTVPAYGGLALHVGAKPGTDGGNTGGDDNDNPGDNPGDTDNPGDNPSTDPNSQVVYYSTNKNWQSYYVHYKVGNGSWTNAPGEQMAPACAGWVSKTLSTNGATVTAAFNNGSGTWDNNGTRDFTMAGAVVNVKDGVVSAGNPCAVNTGTDTNSQVVYYSTNKNWQSYYVHYKVGNGSWTNAPGEQMAPACAGWVSKTLSTNGATVTAAFNNGSGTWDNNGTRDFTMAGAVVNVKDGVVSAGNPCAVNTGTDPNSQVVYYSTNKNWQSYYVHYKVGNGSWTNAPGEQMAPACAGWVSKTLSTNGATVTAAFNNGSGTWDNNGTRDFTMAGAVVNVKDGVVSAGNPCQ